MMSVRPSREQRCHSKPARELELIGSTRESLWTCRMNWVLTKLHKVGMAGKCQGEHNEFFTNRRPVKDASPCYRATKAHVALSDGRQRTWAGVNVSGPNERVEERRCAQTTGEPGSFRLRGTFKRPAGNRKRQGSTSTRRDREPEGRVEGEAGLSGALHVQRWAVPRTIHRTLTLCFLRSDYCLCCQCCLDYLYHETFASSSTLHDLNRLST